MRSSSAFRLLVLALLLCVCVGCLRPGVAFSGVRALRHLEKLCALGPRPVGSSAYVRAGEYIERVLERNGWEVSRQDFAYQGERVRNILGKKGQGPLIIVAAHYDTRPLADRDPADRSQPVVGANDGASGAGVLLELARVLDQDVFQEVQIWLAFLGGEDREEINNWEPAVGAKHLAQSVMASNAQRPEYVLVLNMVGDKDQTLYYEWTSTLWLQEKLFHSAIALGYGEHFVTSCKYAIDDGSHMPFLRWGIPAALVGDFDYPYWRTRFDTPDKVSAPSLERVGRALELMLEGEPFVSSSADSSGQMWRQKKGES